MNVRNLNTLGTPELYDNLAARLGRNGSAATLASNTFVWKDETDDSIVVTLHSTAILRVHTNGDVTLNTGGWTTTTTKQRLNALLPQSIRVFAKDRAWYVKRNGDGTYRFVDGMTLGNAVNPAADHVDAFAGLEADRLEDVRVGR